jgi:hypothetical protein
MKQLKQNNKNKPVSFGEKNEKRPFKDISKCLLFKK